MKGCDWAKKRFSVYINENNSHSDKAMNWEKVFNKSLKGVTSAKGKQNKEASNG